VLLTALLLDLLWVLQMVQRTVMRKAKQWVWQLVRLTALLLELQ